MERRDVASASAPLVVLVEDWDIIEVMATKMLRYGGFDVVAAAHSGILDSLLDQGLEPEIFLLDLELPGESGFSIMRRLRADARYANSTIIAMSALGYRSDRREVIRAGFDGYVVKPLDMSTFVGTIRHFHEKTLLAHRPRWRGDARPLTVG